MGRILGPNETMFWLLDHAAPMNVVAVVPLSADDETATAETLRHSIKALALPVVDVGQGDRPRWSTPQATGTFEYKETKDPFGWIEACQTLLTQRMSTAGAPCARAVLLRHGAAAWFMLAVGHTLCDWRSVLGLATAITKGAPPRPLMPACEEMLPSHAYASPETDDLLDFWWSSHAARNWQAAGVERLTGVLPAPRPPALSHAHLPAPATTHLLAQCQTQGVSLANAIAMAARAACTIDSMAISVDMTRFIKTMPMGQPGLSISHVRAQLPKGDFWDSARALRASLRDQINAGEAGDHLLTLPRALKHGSADGFARRAPAALTSAPFGTEAQGWVVSAARGGGFVLTPILEQDGSLTLIAALGPSDDRDIPAKVIDCLSLEIAP